MQNMLPRKISNGNIVGMSISLLTFSALTSNFGLQVVHLYLKALKIFLLFTATTPTEAKYDDDNDDNYSNTNAHSNPNFNWNNLACRLFEILKVTKKEL